MATSKENIRSNIAFVKDQLAIQKSELISLASKEQGFDWEPLGDRLGILHDPQQRHGWQQIGYLGFATKQKAQQCARALTRQGIVHELEIRKARRITAYKWEIKAVDLNPEVLHHLALNRSQAA